MGWASDVDHRLDPRQRHRVEPSARRGLRQACHHPRRRAQHGRRTRHADESPERGTRRGLPAVRGAEVGRAGPASALARDAGAASSWVRARQRLSLPSRASKPPERGIGIGRSTYVVSPRFLAYSRGAVGGSLRAVSTHRPRGGPTGSHSAASREGLEGRTHDVGDAADSGGLDGCLHRPSSPSSASPRRCVGAHSLRRPRHRAAIPPPARCSQGVSERFGRGAPE